jgi:hypothetical protein
LEGGPAGAAVFRNIQTAAERERKSSGSEKKSVLDSIDENNIEDITFILANGSAQEAVIVLSNISESMGSKIFAKLSPEKQREILSQDKIYIRRGTKGCPSTSGMSWSNTGKYP